MSVQANESFIRPEELWRFLGLRAGQVVVHLGCGAGFYLVPAAQIVGKKGKAIGVDVLFDMLREADGRAVREGVSDVIQTVRADIERGTESAVESAIAHWVLVANILHQADPRTVLREATRIAATDGKVVVIEWDIAASPFGPPDEARIAASDIQELAAGEGLIKERRFSPSPYHWGLVFEKQKVGT